MSDRSVSPAPQPEGSCFLGHQDAFPQSGIGGDQFFYSEARSLRLPMKRRRPCCFSQDITKEQSQLCPGEKGALGVSFSRRILVHPMHFYKKNVIPDKSCTFSV